MSPTDYPEKPVTGGLRRLERAGIGVVDTTQPSRSAAEWEKLEILLASAIEELLWNDFLVIEYDGAPPDAETPAGWVRTGPGGVECAVSSAQQLPPESWPHDSAHFESAGWRPPLTPDRPWTSGPHEPTEAAQRLLSALRFGRSCEDPFAFHWGTGTFPVPEGRTGTLTVIDPAQPDPATDMQSR